ncbi:MAG: phage holin family protein [Patescibacteria group bacterium]
MKYLLRVFVFNVFGLWFAAQLLPTIRISGGWPVLFLAGAVLSLLLLIVKPILSILFIPLNIITFGLVSWLINVIVIYLLTILVPDVTIAPWTFPGLSGLGFIAPSVHLTYSVALVASSLLITIITNMLHKVSED